MRQIAIYGAFDRFNYGDMLFPLILERVLEPYTDAYKLGYYGIIESDLSKLGGKPTKSIEALFDRNNLDDGSIVVVAGGEVLGARWFDIYACLMPENLGSFIRATTRHIPGYLLNMISPNLPGGAVLDLPFVIAPDDFSSRVRVVYNSVGGTSLAKINFPSRLVPAVQTKLKKAAFLSVRDQNSLKLLNGSSFPNLAMLAPDSASLVSVYFPEKYLLERVGSEVLHCLDEFNNGYFVLQVALQYLRDENVIRQLVHEIETIYVQYRLPVVLCPIGTAFSHEDHVALREIQKLLNTPSKLIENPTIFEIMVLIAKSRIFIGTSLHGAITAMSFGVPNLALTHEVPKLDAYLDTWALPSLRGSVSIETLSQNVGRAILVPKRQMEQKRQELIDASLASFDLMKKALDGSVAPDYSVIQRKMPYKPITRPCSSIILITHSNLWQVSHCLQRIKDHTLPDDYELIIVDNASTDGTHKLVEDFAKTHDNVQLIEFAQKQRYPRLFNDGAKLASSNSMIFLDSATIIPAGWLQSLMRLLLNDGIGIVSPVSDTLVRQGLDECSKEGENQWLDLRVFDEFAGQLAIARQGKRRNISLSSSFCMAIRRTLFDDVGRFDEQFGSRLISAQDLAMRLIQKGYCNVCAEDVFLHVWGDIEPGSMLLDDGLTWLPEDITAFDAKWGTKRGTLTMASEQMAITNSFLSDSVIALFDLVVKNDAMIFALRDELAHLQRIFLTPEKMAENAFLAYRVRDMDKVRYWALRCIRSDPRWLRNRGLSSILLESWIGHRMMSRLRRKRL